MSVPFRLAVLGVAAEELEGIRVLATDGGKRIELHRLNRVEELAQVDPSRTDAILVVHGPPEQDVMAWLPRFHLAETLPVVVLTEVNDDREDDRLHRAGAFAVARRECQAELGHEIQRTLERTAALSSETDLRRMAGLVGVIGNTLRGELGGIRNAIEVLSFQCSGEGVLSLRRSIEYLDHQCRRMESLLEDYSEVSRLGLVTTAAGGGGVIELGSSLDRAINRTRSELGGSSPSISREPRQELCWLAIDPKRLEQLVRHALNYVRGVNFGCLRLRVDYQICGEWIDLEIRTVPDRAGSPVAGLHALDLDLFLASTLADRYGGRVRSGPPFVIQLPRSMEQQVEDPEGTGVGVAARAPKRNLLMIDDHPATVEVLGLLIGRQGWNVRVTSDIFEALEVIRTFRPEVVLIDLHMPLMKGDALARLIRRDESAGRPMLIGISGSTELSSEDERVVLSWFDHVLVKPVRSDQVAALLPPPKDHTRSAPGQGRPGSVEP
jgi:CheY-like chemotaxis protein